MDVRSYQEIKDLFRPDWDAAILDILCESPCRFTDLTRRMRMDVDVGIADGTLSRSLARLQRDRLIRAADNLGHDAPSRVYEVTARGRKKLATYRVLIEAYQRSRGDLAG